MRAVHDSPVDHDSCGDKPPKRVTRYGPMGPPTTPVVIGSGLPPVGTTAEGVRYSSTEGVPARQRQIVDAKRPRPEPPRAATERRKLDGDVVRFRRNDPEFTQLVDPHPADAGSPSTAPTAPARQRPPRCGGGRCGRSRSRRRGRRRLRRPGSRAVDVLHSVG